MKRLTPKRRLALEVALDACQMHQDAFWEAKRGLEELLGAETVDDLIEVAQ